MTWTLQQATTQTGRIAIITGANIGLGFEAAMALAGKGCTVVLACRNAEKAEAARHRIVSTHRNAVVECLPLDLSSLQSVRAFASTFRKRHQRLDLLINNAGIMMPPYSLSEDGFESQLAANYLGHFALTGLLLSLITATPGARVVSLSSLAHRWGGIWFDDLNFSLEYNAREAYAQSKLACLMFAYELQRRLRNAGSTTLSVAAHPGVSATNLFKHLPKIARLFSPLMSIMFQSANDGARPVLYAALGADINGGDYIGPKSMGEMRGSPVKVRSNGASRDEAVAARLWCLSEELTGVRFFSESSGVAQRSE